MVEKGLADSSNSVDQAVAKVVSDNFSSILKILDVIKNDRYNSDDADVAESFGIKKIMLNLEFRIAMIVAKKILSILQPADVALQGQSSGLKDARTIIKCVQSEMTKMRSDVSSNFRRS